MKPDDIRKMSRGEREAKLKELKQELIKLRYQAKMGHIDNPGRIRNIKRTIARILTINREEELGIARQPKTTSK
ncbi:50S ribosomal protein L29 [Ignicoccus islandicus DSM 13165]|uniref:Large ribosomal subunit protein uL29 n=1 Tax=Ignicoccus islandicus DSM 13165 TaxID=940295 RepID=A0A0U3F7E9_9CREN|nr:50S ribosomal protein L29 [Ignicoccus islandicus]ALU11561.1 50S ribosomal protein L29 [Ignicoccus islandicus DSM 13165]